MENLKTKYGVLNDVSYIGRYNTGEIEEIKLESETLLCINGYNFIPQYGYCGERRKELPSVKFFKDGNIKAISLEEATVIQTEVGEIEVEKIIFYEDGSFNRVFPNDGKISGFWSEEDEYEIAKEYSFDLGWTSFKSKIISLQFYTSGKLKSITLWPKDRIYISTKFGVITGRIGVSLYEHGTLASCEPAKPTTVPTQIGSIEAYDENALGIHAEKNSLVLNMDGTVKSLVTSTNVIEVQKLDGETIIHSPKEVMLYSNSETKDLITVSIEFQDDYIIIDKKFKYNINDCKFNIKYFGEKKLLLFGDSNLIVK